MRLVRASQAGAVGVVLLPLDPHQKAFSDGIIMYCDKAGAAHMTAQVDGTISDLGNLIPMTFSQTTTAITITTLAANPHTLGVASATTGCDYCLISGTNIAGVDGIWPVGSITNATVVVATSQTSQSKTGSGFLTPIRLYQQVIGSAAPAITVTIPTVTAANPFYTIPFSALILNVSAWATAGICYLDVRQSGSSH